MNEGEHQFFFFLFLSFIFSILHMQQSNKKQNSSGVKRTWKLGVVSRGWLIVLCWYCASVARDTRRRERIMTVSLEEGI